MHDRQRALQALERNNSTLELVQSVQIAKRSELHAFKVLPKRWVVERAFVWLEKCRRLWKRCKRKLNTSLQLVHLAFLILLLRR